MTEAFAFEIKKPEDFPHWEFDHIDLEYDTVTRAVWMNYKVSSPPFYAMQTLADMASVRDSLRHMYELDGFACFPVRYFVMSSNKKSVFSLGGDLVTFTSSIRSGRRDRLIAYAHACIDLIYSLVCGLYLPIVSLAAVRGQCLGGGFEAALASDFILAEESAKLGVPEASFNAFPGMGAVSLLTRRLGVAQAERIIGAGAIHPASEMLELGAIDLTTPDGSLRAAADAWMLEGGDERWLRRRALSEARRSCFPVTRDELIEITDLWADCSTALSDQDLRHMERLAAAQKRMTSSGGTAEDGRSR
ncbi:enoyl-CoA hydratase/isomerase family protein [Methylosinus sp. H3A]|uniref:crotonase/enoyl-CoA hydratase family protein n=1 Tax=Methylosinus sp. H3A TaxID=2785786 RepID=UPI0018C29803|nr:crotonase/enoyl-CoA hydratase family protein [Methylosinus sp. H3A]MBG0811770.1 enoyl-CoA hydratase/isomerase family protein [Methylosinus sp. H3A]